MTETWWVMPKAAILALTIAATSMTGCTGSGGSSSESGNSAPITEGPQGPAAVPGVNITKVSSSVSANPLTAGQVQTAKISLKSDVSLSGVIVDIRIYNSANQMISKKTFEPVTFSANTAVHLEYAYPSTASLAAGTYTVQVGMWNTSWQTYYYEHVNQFNVVASGTTVPSTCVYPNWVQGKSYAAGSIVTYNGKLYRAKYANPGYNPTISTYYWAAYTCTTTSTTTTTTTTTVPTTPTPTTTTTMPQSGQSADGTMLPPATRIVDANGAAWTISGGVVLRNGVAAGYSANVVLLIYKGGKVYQSNSAGGFWYWDGSAWIASSDPRGTTQPPPPPSTGGISMPLIPNPIPPDSISLTCVDSQRQFKGSFFVENNMWGAAGVSPAQQCAGIGGLASDGSVSAKWTWNYGTGPNEVKGYPSITYGQRPGYPKTSGSVLPMLVNNLSTAQVSYNGAASANGKGHNAFDIWLTSDGVDRGIFFNNNITHEIMISTNNWGTYGDYPNPAWLFENEVTIDGMRFRVIKADNFPPGGVGGRTWRFIVFKMLDDRPAAALNLMSFINYMKSKGLITGREYMNSIEYGTEQEYGSGEVKIHGYKLNVR